MRLLLLGFALVSLLFLQAQVAQAIPPETIKGEFHIVQVDAGDLCGFPIEFHFDGTTSTRFYFDKNGNAVRVQFHAPDDARATNLNNGKYLTGHEVINISADLTTFAEKRTGLPVHFNHPSGTVLIDAGQISFDPVTGEVKIVGRHQLIEGDFAAFCAALS